MTLSGRMVRASLLLGTLVLAACGGPGVATPRASRSAAPAPAPTIAPSATSRSSYAIAVLAPDLHTVLFLGGDGSTLARVTSPPDSATFPASAAGRLWYQGMDGHLRTVGIDGRQTDMGVLQGLGPGAGATAAGLAVSADGRRWAWGECVCANSNGRARLYVGGVDAAARVVLDEPTTNEVLNPLAWTARGLFVARQATGLGGCCYFPDEVGVRDMLLVDPTTLQLSQTWKGCATAHASALGAFACTGPVSTVHLPDGSTRTVAPTKPAVVVGWVRVDDVGGRVVLGVIHSRGNGDGGCPCTIDTEAVALGDGAITKLADQMTPDDVLPDGRIVAKATPVMPGQDTVADWIVSPDGTRTRLGPDSARFLAVVSLP
jgi:hypothetical protein